MCEILIVGAGPVGMLLAILLHQQGRRVVVVDRRTAIYPHSRAIGIHPPGLDALELAGLADTFVSMGKFVRGGLAYLNGMHAGRLRFDDNPGRWKYPLIVPQYVTEQVLQDELDQLEIPILWGWNFISADQSDHHVTVMLEGPEGMLSSIECELLVGCDGKRSTVRESMGSISVGGQYRDRYVMADFDDDSALGDYAVVNLHRDGLVECFPLPNGRRRWVARLQNRDTEGISESVLIRIVQSRFSDPPVLSNPIMFSSFGVERWLTDHVVSERIVLAGDAAHVVSPIGGQGMNLGWMDTVDLAKCIHDCGSLRQSSRLKDALKAYGRIVRNRANKGIRRAWFNTVMGRPNTPMFIKRSATHLIVNTGMQKVFARRFTMSDL